MMQCVEYEGVNHILSIFFNIRNNSCDDISFIQLKRCNGVILLFSIKENFPLTKKTLGYKARHQLRYNLN